MARVRRERWTRARCVAVGGGILGFYLSYAAYRNLKAIVPLLRPDTLFDRQLADLDRDLFLGHDPAVLLHSLLGTGITAHILSSGYVVFIVFLPLSLALALVFAPNLRGGLFFATALSANWLIGAGSYFLLPSLGPVYYDPGTFASLPHSEVTHLQDDADGPARGVPRPPDDGDAAGDRRVRLAARLDEPDGGAGRPPPRARAADEDRALGLARR